MSPETRLPGDPAEVPGPQPLKDEDLAEIERSPWAVAPTPVRLIATVRHWKRIAAGLQESCEDYEVQYRADRASLEAAKAMLQKLEWSGIENPGEGYDACPECCGTVYWSSVGKAPPVQVGGHEPNCALAALLGGVLDQNE